MLSTNSKIKKIKTKMAKKKKKTGYISLASKHGFPIAIFLVVAVFGLASFSFVKADEFQRKINALKNQNEVKQDEENELGAQASSLNDAINKLQAQINAKQRIINQHQAEVDKLKKEIAAAQKELDKQKRILGTTIKTIYVEGDITTLEMLATSKNLSDFFDKQQYRESVQNKVKETLDKITQLKLDLNTKKEKTEKLIAEQKDLQDELLAQRGEKDRLLSLNQSERAELDQEIKANNKRITKLQAEQAAANARLFAGSGVRIVAGNGRNTYPNPWRSAPMNSYVDNWGMFSRQCVSYAAWKVYERWGYMPVWGGRDNRPDLPGMQSGNANDWDENAGGKYKYPVNTTPKAGSVAVSNAGEYGHVMFVESVNSDGTINISQYNANWNGHYSEAYNVPTWGLVFIHFR